MVVKDLGVLMVVRDPRVLMVVRSYSFDDS